ncbi:MAG: HD domain-containing phosphohydrolase [Solirubrobacteraceae bacterium]
MRYTERAPLRGVQAHRTPPLRSAAPDVLRPGYVLLVDDDPQVLRLLDRVLSRERYVCRQARSAAEARTFVAAGGCEVLMCDVNMPGSSGLDLVNDLLREEDHPAVLMMSGEQDPATARQAIDIGAYGFIVKPFNAWEVVIAVDNASRRRCLEIENRRHRSHLEEGIAQRTADLERVMIGLRESQTETIDRLARAVEFRDHETGDHIERMSRLCEEVATHLNVDSRAMRIASPLHDVGKIAVPDHILLKPGSLDPEERKTMERHADIGHRLLADSQSELLKLAATIAWTHHERYDGSGYPRGLAGDDIPLAGRIAAVADVFDALTSDRVYRPAFEWNEAVEIMRAERGAHFDPVVLDALFAVLEDPTHGAGSTPRYSGALSV